MRESLRLGFGPRLTAEEHDRLVRETWADVTPLLVRGQIYAAQRREFELRVDYRLGTLFPRARREDLWAATRRVDRRIMLLSVPVVAFHVIRLGFVHGTDKAARHLDGYATREYGKLLTPVELTAYIGDAP